MNNRPVLTRPARRGMAMIIAVATIAMVAVALTGLSVLFAAEAKRTRAAAADAQARQMLLAGADDAVARARRWGAAVPDEAWAVPLPDPLAGRPAALAGRAKTVTPDPPAGPAVDVTIEATLAGRVSRQRLRFAREGDRWRLDGAELQP